MSYARGMRLGLLLLLATCGHPPPQTAVDAPIDVAPVPDVAIDNSCAASGAPGTCIAVAACNAMPDRTPFAGHCPGAADIQCCIQTPDPANDPPTPTGYQLMKQADVTPAMTTWAVAILHDPVAYPMFASTTMMFGALLVLARVEWHPPDFQNSVVHRGVTLYEPI